MKLVFWIVVGTLAFLILLFLFLLFPAVRRHPDRERLLRGKLIAHRGLHAPVGDAPENSLGAFRAAIDAGFAIETDIHVTRDGEVIVFHDDTLTRMCGDDRRPEDLTLEELRQFRLAGSGEGIPTFREFLDTVGGKVPLLIEFKCTDRATCVRLCAAADEILSGYTGDYLIQSFYPFVLRWYRKNRPSVCRGQLSTAFRRDSFARKLLGCLLFNFLGRPDFISYEHKFERHICRRICCSVLGAFPVCWTIRSEEELTAAKKHFQTYIFENFLPGEEER